MDQLNKAGFKAEPYYLESAAAFEKLDKREVDDMFMIGSCTSYEGQGDLSDLAADSASNYGRWRNDEFEEVYAQLLTEFDVETRRELIYQHRTSTLTLRDPLYVMIGVQGINNDLDWSPNPTGRADVRRCQIQIDYRFESLPGTAPKRRPSTEDKMTQYIIRRLHAGNHCCSGAPSPRCINFWPGPMC